MNVIDLQSYKQSKKSKKSKKEVELLMFYSELKQLLRLKDHVEFNISIMQEVISNVEDEICENKDK
mgnify:CR=1 FL=1